MGRYAWGNFHSVAGLILLVLILLAIFIEPKVEQEQAQEQLKQEQEPPVIRQRSYTIDESNYVVVKANDGCYSVTDTENDNWVASECFATFAEANELADGLNRTTAERNRVGQRVWTQVEE